MKSTNRFFRVCAVSRYEFQSFLNTLGVSHHDARHIRSAEQLNGCPQGGDVFLVNEYYKHRNYDDIAAVIEMRQLRTIKVQIG